MKEIAQNIKSVLEANAVLTTLVSTDIYWSLAPEKQEAPFVLFDVGELRGLTKDRRGYTSTLRCFAKDMDAAADVYEQVKQTLENAGHYFVSGTSGITDDEYREAVMELNFNLKNT